jgi:hypothetical protein
VKSEPNREGRKTSCGHRGRAERKRAGKRKRKWTWREMMQAKKDDAAKDAKKIRQAHAL